VSSRKFEIEQVGFSFTPHLQQLLIAKNGEWGPTIRRTRRLSSGWLKVESQRTPLQPLNVRSI
jgi:hypothetical protein